MTYDGIKENASFLAVINALIFMGSALVYTVYNTFTIPVINTAMLHSINWFFNLIFSSLNLLGFFIRPSTIKNVVELFTFFWCFRLLFKSCMVFIKTGRFVVSYVQSFIGKSTRIILKLFGL